MHRGPARPGTDLCSRPGWHTAHIGGFFAFDADAPEHALRFIEQYFDGTSPDYVQAWNAHCLDEHVLPTPTFTCGAGVRIEFAKVFWNNWLNSGTLVATNVATWPGTVIVKQIRLAERIDIHTLCPISDKKE